MNNQHATCDHVYGICFDVATSEEEFARLSEMARERAEAIADFDREFGLA